MKNIYLLVAIIIVVPLFTVLLSKMEVKDAQDADVLYCENVKDWKASNGQRGWPDYNENYDIVCN